MKSKLVKITPQTNALLDKLSEKRKEEGAFIRTKQDIVAEAVQALFKREEKK